MYSSVHNIKYSVKYSHIFVQQIYRTFSLTTLKFYKPKILTTLFCTLHPWQPTFYLLFPWIFFFYLRHFMWEKSYGYLVTNLFCLTFYPEDHPSCIMWENFLPFSGCIKFHCMYTLYFFIHSSVYEHLGWLHLLDIVDNATMNKVYRYSSRSCFEFFWYIPRNKIIGTYS